MGRYSLFQLLKHWHQLALLSNTWKEIQKSKAEKIFFFFESIDSFMTNFLYNLELLNFTFVCKYAWNMKQKYGAVMWYVVHGVCVFSENKYWKSHHMNSKLIIIRGNWMRLTIFVCSKFQTISRIFQWGNIRPLVHICSNQNT